MKKQLAGILALAMSLSMAACSSDSDSGEAPASETTTTAADVKDETTAKADDENSAEAEAETEETTAETAEEAEDDYFEKALALLPDVELKRAYQEVKVLSYYEYELPELAVRLFEEKYGGTVNYNLTAYGILLDNMEYGRVDLAVVTYGSLPSQRDIAPVDDCIDLDSDIWSFAKDNKDYMEFFNFGGKHFAYVTDVFANYVCYYNKKTIEERGFDDPWELFNNGLLAPEHDKPQLLGDGDLLFYIGYMSQLYTAPENMKVSFDDIGIVPVPSPAGSAPYQSADFDIGFSLVSNSQNPQGAELFAQCLALAYSDPAYIAEKEQKQKEKYEEYGLSDQIISQLDEINELAKQYPVIDYAYKCIWTSDFMFTMNHPISSAFSGDSIDSKFYDNFPAYVEYDNEKMKTYIESLG